MCLHPRAKMLTVAVYCTYWPFTTIQEETTYLFTFSYFISYSYLLFISALSSSIGIICGNSKAHVWIFVYKKVWVIKSHSSQKLLRSPSLLRPQGYYKGFVTFALNLWDITTKAGSWWQLQLRIGIFLSGPRTGPCAGTGWAYRPKGVVA